MPYMSKRFLRNVCEVLALKNEAEQFIEARFCRKAAISLRNTLSC